MKPEISIIVPLAPGEQEWTSLLECLDRISEVSPVVFASSESRPEGFPCSPGIEWLECPAVGRAPQMNHAAQYAEGTHLWFVHVDSRIDDKAHGKLLAEVESLPDSLHYFRLRFFDGGALMRINEWGANLRSSWFGAPFGDQAFCVSRDLFDSLGGYNEQCSYGEDHLFVRKARKRGIRLNCIDHAIGTSARKYRKMGWLNVVVRHQAMWIAQAIRDR